MINPLFYLEPTKLSLLIKMASADETPRAFEADDIWSFGSSKKTKKPASSGFDFGLDEPLKAEDEPQPVDDDLWAFAVKKDKKKKKKVAEPDETASEQPPPENAGFGGWGDNWGTTKWGFGTPNTKNVQAQDAKQDSKSGLADLNEPSAPSNEDDWTAAWAIPKKKKKGRSGDDFAPAETAKVVVTEEPKECEKPSVDLNEEAPPGHGAIGACVCDGCMKDARNKIADQLQEPSWTSNYISKLQAQISNLEHANMSLEMASRRSRRYSYSDCSSASPSDDERPPIRFPAYVPPPPEVVADENTEQAALEENGLKVDIKRRRKVGILKLRHCIFAQPPDFVAILGGNKT